MTIAGRHAAAIVVEQGAQPFLAEGSAHGVVSRRADCSIEVVTCGCLHRDVGLDRVVGRMALDLEILDAVVIDARRVPDEPHLRERARLARDLFARLIEVIEIEVGIAADPDELARTKIRLLRKHRLKGGTGHEVEGFSGRPRYAFSRYAPAAVSHSGGASPSGKRRATDDARIDIRIDMI